MTNKTELMQEFESCLRANCILGHNALKKDGEFYVDKEINDMFEGYFLANEQLSESNTTYEQLRSEIESLKKDNASQAKKIKNSEGRGYAMLGTGKYIISHSAKHAELGAELIISVATEAEKLEHKVGDVWDNKQDLLIHSNAIVLSIGFINTTGIDVLEGQLKLMREVHFPDPLPASPDSEVK